MVAYAIGCGAAGCTSLQPKDRFMAAGRTVACASGSSTSAATSDFDQGTGA
jgi:hypothetical protein